MSSSTSNSDRLWRRFAVTFLLASALPAALLYLFVVLIDPWGMLPWHLPIARVPISTNARFSFPALAVSPEFDSVIVGTSTARLLRPAVLDRPLDARFANLAMNSATAWEQARMLELFARTHPHPRAVVIDLDAAWCQAGPDSPKTTGRSFPRWMYDGPRTAGYLRMANLYALQEAANQFAVAAGLKRRRYGLDGYTDFLPPETEYDPRKVEALFRRWGSASRSPPPGPVSLPSVEGLPALLRPLPRRTVKILLLPPITTETLGVPGSAVREAWDACRRDVEREAPTIANALVVDFTTDHAIDDAHINFWDPIHYRVPVADLVMAALIARARPLMPPAWQ